MTTTLETSHTLGVPALNAVAPDAPTTIAFVHRGHDWISGAEQCMLDLVGRLDRARFRPVVICPGPILGKAAEQLGAAVYLYPDWHADMTRRPAAYARIREIIDEVEPALIHANMTTPLPGLVPIARRRRIPLVAHLHMPLTDRWTRLHDCIHQATVAVGVARHVLRPLADDGMPARRLRLIYNAVNASRIEAGDATGLRAELGIPADATVVISVGTLIHRKAHDVSVRAIALARTRGADVRLLICGPPDPTDNRITLALRALVAELGVGDAVHFLGYRTDVGAIARDAADVLAASARDEALPLNVLEAQWVGLPVIASDIPAHFEAITPGTTGLIVPVDDPHALADALVGMAQDPARRRALGEAGRTFAREHFSMARYVNEFAALYTELLGRPRSQFGWVRGSSWPRAYTTWVGRVVGMRLGLRRPDPILESAA